MFWTPLTEVSGICFVAEQKTVVVESNTVPEQIFSMCKLVDRNRLAKVETLEYRYLGGFTLPEVADILDVSYATFEREWQSASS